MDIEMENFEKQVKDIEVECSKILEIATQKSEIIVSKAKNLAAKNYTEGVANLEKDKDKKIKKINEIFNKKRTKLTNQADKELDQFEKQGKNKIDLAVKKILDLVDQKYEEL